MRRSLSAPLNQGCSELKGRIFDIQSFSVHDGPGCRTLILCPDALYAVHGAVILKVFSINKESFFSDRNVSIPKIKPASDASKLVLMERCATILKIKIIR